MPASPFGTVGEFLHGVGQELDIQDATMLSLTVDGIEPKLTMEIGTLATRNLEIRINEDMSYQDEVNAAGNRVIRQFAAVLQEQPVAGDEYQDITETPEAKDIIRLLRVLLEGYKVQTRGSSGCEEIVDEIVDEIVTWFKEKVKTCQSLDEMCIAFEEDFVGLAYLIGHVHLHTRCVAN